ncbi:hypothetical protein BN1708_001983 [Verticillium longisporum]|uniref:rRNA adenine N(6)-methyltransferase n=1 Tax=Verticillium longisporum TaxID=100787 RepID=A0A0G4KD56_VERLO|nr:hypothetical protein BN1708_001983 [Verticillium longisporum]
MANNNLSTEKPEIVLVDDNRDVSDDVPEKAPHARVIDSFHVLGLTDDDVHFYDNYTPEQRKRTMRKVDVRLTPMLAVLYLISHLDRSNIGNTKIEGIDVDLGISGIQWNIVLSLFFVPYILLENFGGLLALRMLLGVFEAGFFPGAVYLCTFWYMPRDLASRISWFYCMSALSGAFSGLLAAGIAKMDGVGGYEGWRWIFLIEGIITVALGIMTFFCLVDTPALSEKWLDPDEIRFLELQHFIKQGGRFQDEAKEDKYIWQDLKACVLNWRLWLVAYIQFCQSAMSYGTKLNLPTITRSMGFENTQAQLMTAPPYVAGAISSIVFSQFSDRYYWRMPFVVVPFSCVCVGFSIMLGLRGNFENQIGPSYFAAVIACIGIYPAMPAATSWAANNLAPASRRAVGLALNIALGNMGGIMGSYMFFDSDAPMYNTGFGLSLAFGLSGLLMAFAAEAAYKWGNKKKEAMSEEDIRARYTQDQLLKMGDRSPFFPKSLADTGVWSYISRRRTREQIEADEKKEKTRKKSTKPKPKGDRARVNITNDKFCDDVIDYIAPSLERHVGCDLLDINPGAGVWSKKLNDFLKPRSHILMEPDAELYKPFLDPLLERPGAKLVPESGILWTELTKALGYLEHQVEQPRSSGTEPSRNDTLLVTANLSFYPKRRFRNFDSVAVLVLYQLLTSIRLGSLFQKYGLVRMLLWINDDDKRTFLPRSIQNRKKSALQAEFSCEHLAEIAGKDPASLKVTPEQLKKMYARDQWINIESSRNTLARMKAAGIKKPPSHRRMALTDEVMKNHTGTEPLAGKESTHVVRPYLAELDELNRLAAEDKLGAPKSKGNARRAILANQLIRNEREVAIFDELIHEQQELTRLHSSGELTSDEFAAREKAYSERVAALPKNSKADYHLLRDNYLLFRQDPPALLYDRRPWEPLRVEPGDFFPNVETALLDIQPKAMHPLLRNVGSGSSVTGDIFDLIQRSMLSSSLDPVEDTLDKLWPGAREAILENCPSLRDPAKGGLPGTGPSGICSRLLNEQQWMEILDAFMKWPFRPSHAELIGRLGDDLAVSDPLED